MSSNEGPGAFEAIAEHGGATTPEPTATVVDDQIGGGGSDKKKKTRHGLLRGISRVSSSSSLSQMRRARSSSAPYRPTASLSCASLSLSPSPFAPSTTTSYFSQASPDFNSSTPSTAFTTPGTEFSGYFDGCEALPAPRRVDNVGRSRGLSSTATASLPSLLRPKRSLYSLWSSVPHEIKVGILRHLTPRELMRISRVNKEFYRMAFDGQLWTSFDASSFYDQISADSLAKIIVAAGPFVKDLNLRGCVQLEHAEIIVRSCRNLINASLEGCRNIQKSTLHNLLQTNERLANLNLTALSTVANSSCRIIARSCPQLEVFNVSWCTPLDARGIKVVVEGCSKLRDLRAGEVRGFGNEAVAEAIFTTNNLERLVLNGCEDLSDEALRTMLHGRNPEIDVLTDRPMVPPRKLRHLNLTRCSQLSSFGVKALGYAVPDLEGLQLSGCSALTDEALEAVLASTPRLKVLELEDMTDLTNNILSQHLAKAPCAATLEHLSISYCEGLGDAGTVPLLRNCKSLRTIEMDNTRISDLTLAEAAALVRKRIYGASAYRSIKVGLTMYVYDCQNVTWTGVREVLCRNAETVVLTGASRNGDKTTSCAEIIALKCFYGWQMTVDEHTKRVLKGDVLAATRLERKWAGYMQANEEMGAAGGSATRRRRRRAREAQQQHADEEDGGTGAGGRRRARTAACVVM